MVLKVDDKETATVVEWMERNVGTVVDVRPQPRWRPQYFVDVEREGKVEKLFVRGERRDMDLTWPLKHEMTFQDLMYKDGVLIPKVWGWIDEMPAYVMDYVPGQPNFVDTPDEDRDRVVDEYLQQLAHLHTRDIAPYVEAGIDRADTPEESAMIGMDRLIGTYRRQKVRYDPLMEFCIGWFYRHPPLSKGREAAVVWDSGQLHHDRKHLTGVIDVELGHIGDPMIDLAGWRMRDSIIGFGDFAKIYARYGELVGEEPDLEAIELHHFAFTLSNQLGFSHALLDPPPGSDFATNLQWCNETNIYATEAMAEYLGVELPTGVETPAPRKSKVAKVHEHLIRNLRAMQQMTDDDYLQHQIRISFRVARHLARFDEIGEAVIDENLDDLHQLLGKRPADWEEGEIELERFVLADAAEGRHDLALLDLFHKRNLRAQMLNGPEGSAMSRHIPIQPFR